METVDLDLCLKTGMQLAKAAGKMIKDAFKKKKNVSLKSSPVDLVTETDEAVEKFLFTELRKVFPDHKYIGEESVAAGEKVHLTDAPTWIIDPVDGTMNFVHSFPFVCVSIGLTINKEPVIGVIYNPILDQMYHARKGCGAFLNDEKISASGETELSKSLVIGEMGTQLQPDKMKSTLANLTTFVKKAHAFRFMGSAALNMCLVANGAADVYYTMGIHCWDVAAGAVILREAGATCIDPAVASGGADCYSETGIHVWDVAAGAAILTEAGAVVLDTAGGTFDLLSRRVLCAGSSQLAQHVATLLDQFQPPRD